MTTTKKPRAARTATRPRPELTPNQLRVVQLFAAMDEKTQIDVLPIIEAWSIRFPRHKRPSLRLVGGGTR